MEVDSQVFERYHQEGKGPVYMDCTGISEEDLRYLISGLEDEANLAALEHLKEEGVDLRKNPIEFATYELRCTGRLLSNERAETAVPGLYVAGDESGLSISGASVFGWIAAENAVDHARERDHPETDIFSNTIAEKAAVISALLERKGGPDWYEANMALNHTMADYAGLVRSEAVLQGGLGHLQRLKGKLDQSLTAQNRWELTRCLEVMNLYDLGELVFRAALERQESRGRHRRVDYPYSDPLLNGKMLVVKKGVHGPDTEWRDLPE